MDPQVAQLRARIQDLEQALAARQAAILREALPKGRIGQVVSLVAREWDVDPLEMIGHGRRPGIAQPRLVAMAVAHRALGMSKIRIGTALRRHPSTVLYACQRIDADCQADDALAEKMNRLVAAAKSLPHPTRSDA